MNRQILNSESILEQPAVSAYPSPAQCRRNVPNWQSIIAMCQTGKPAERTASVVSERPIACRRCRHHHLGAGRIGHPPIDDRLDSGQLDSGQLDVADSIAAFVEHLFSNRFGVEQMFWWWTPFPPNAKKRPFSQPRPTRCHATLVERNTVGVHSLVVS